jgi:hypothetical protein
VRKELTIEKKQQAFDFYQTAKDAERYFTASRKMMEGITKHIQLDVRKNEPCFFKIPVRNIFEHKEIFTVQLSDDVSAKYSEEVKLVRKLGDVEIWTN